MALQEGRFTASAEGRSKGVTLLVPRQVVEAEQRELMDYITSAKVQNLIVFLRRGGLRHLDVNEPIRNGEHKGLNPLHVAINKTNASVVSALLELATGVSPDARSKAGDRPLHLACAVGDVGMVRALIEYKADANLTNNKRLTPLLVAAANAKDKTYHHVCASELVKNGGSLICRDSNGDTPLHLACDGTAALPFTHEVLKAAKDHATCKLDEAIEALNLKGEGVLHRACEKEHAEVAMLLMKAGARSDARSGAGDTALHCAARTGLETIAMALLEKPDLALNASNLSGETPLHLAMSSGTAQHARIARELLARGAFAFGRTRNGDTVLHACAREGNTALASLILSRQTQATADALNARANNGGTPLHVATKYNQEGMLNLLLSQENIDRGICDIEGNTPVHIACERGDLPLLKKLLGGVAPEGSKTARGHAIGPRELSVRNGLGWAALHACAFHGHDTALRLLLQWQSPIDHRTADGWTALHLAVSEGRSLCVSSLLRANASIDAHHPSGESALGLAAIKGHNMILKELLKHGASPDLEVDEYGWTPMHSALAYAEDESVPLAMMEGGGRIKSRKDAPSTPKVGEPIRYVPTHLKKAMVDADERRRRKNRLSGRDSDDGDDVGEAENLPGYEPPSDQHWFAPPGSLQQVMIPPPRAGEDLPYLPKGTRAHKQAGLFGYFGDHYDVKEELKRSKSVFMAGM